MSTDRPSPPKYLRGNLSLTQRVIRQKLWKPPNIKNNWAVFAMVGREGSGKSYTTMSMLYAADDTFDAERVFFDPLDVMDFLRGLAPEERTGKAIMLDESGVGMGVRSWYEKDQIKFNKAMQTARDDNMIVGLTLPRLTELDSQFRGRIHGFCEMNDLEPNEYANFSWKNYDPTRDERDDVYKKFPRMRNAGVKWRVTDLKIGPPPAWLIKAYEEKKTAFKEKLYKETFEEMDEDDAEKDPKQIAQEIKTNGLEDYVSIDNKTGRRYIDREIIRIEHGLSQADARGIKSYLEKEVPEERIQEAV